MRAMTIRNIPEETHRALKIRAQKNGRSTEAEVRAILTDAVAERSTEGIGTLLRRIGAEADTGIVTVRDSTTRPLPAFQ